jgi:glycosyltransferase involved in cell wall biosynthesis
MTLLSAVIPFRNRAGSRLRSAVRSIHDSCALDHEIIISDFGSDDPDVAQEVADEFQARVVYTPADHWSRSAALNAGFRAARGRVFLGADADIIWGPGAIDHAAREVARSESHAIAFECQFMGPDVTVEDVLANGSDWKRFDSSSRLNPRWGVGMLFFPARAFDSTNGYEARMRTYGYEDNDFSARVRASGYPIRWEGSGEYRAYHIWHKPVGQIAKTDQQVAQEYAANKVIFENERGVVRNVVDGGVGDSPLVSVSIATRDRADLLEDALSSILCQTVQDFEVIIIDDGSTDNTREVVESFNDPRFRYFYQEAAGISAARNKALDVSRGRFTAVMDDDDIMPPWRLERSLASIHAGEHGAVGTFVTFSDVSGEMISWADPFPTLLGASMRGGFAGHPTWMIRTDVMRAFRYDETYTSAVDNNIALRMVRSGVKIRHAGDVFNLRRVHDRQVTATDQQFQGRGAKLNGRWLHAGIPAATIQENNKRAQKTQNSRKPSPAELDAIIPYLPDRLIDRTLTIQTATITATQRIRDTLPVSQSVEATHEGGYLAQLELPGATWRQAADLIRMPDATILNWHATLKTTEQPRKRDEAKGGVVLLIEKLAGQVSSVLDEPGRIEGQLTLNASRFQFSRHASPTTINLILTPQLETSS